MKGFFKRRYDNIMSRIKADMQDKKRNKLLDAMDLVCDKCVKTYGHDITCSRCKVQELYGDILYRREP